MVSSEPIISCRFCGKEVPADATFCHHCGANLKAPVRPAALTVIAVICIISGASGIIFSLLIPAMQSSYRSMQLSLPSLLLGIKVPLAVMIIAGIIASILKLYCGIGLMGLKIIARKLFIGLFVFTIVNSVLNVMASVQTFEDETKTFGFLQMPMLFSAGFGLIFGIAVYGIMFYYVYTRKNLFKN